MIFRLDERMLFPDPALAEDDGLLAVGGDLSMPRLLLAYRHGIFPWYGEDEPILWFSPHERFVLYPEELQVSKSMRRILNSDKFRVTVNTCFEDVISACSKAPRLGQDGNLDNAGYAGGIYQPKQKKGHAHSVEVWEHDTLVGGLYGVQVGNVFCGESMFSKVSNASKVALINLCGSGAFDLIDCQVHTPHLESMGARMIGREVYTAELRKGRQPLGLMLPGYKSFSI